MMTFMSHHMKNDMKSNSIPAMLGQEYFVKPMHALFRAYDLAAYDKVSLDIRRPILDLGCGNGAFGSVFCRTRGVEGFDFGVDFDAKNVRLARRRGNHKVVFRADARALPVENGTIHFMVANGVLCCIRPGHDTALSEIARVLAPGSQFVMTVPTPAFTEILFPTRFLRRLAMNPIADFYVAKTNKRHGHRTVEAYEMWEKALERVGLKIEAHVHYFAGREAIWWSVFAMRPFQLFATLRYSPTALQRLAITFTEMLVRSVRETVNTDEQAQGYLLILARKV
jgi:SAM-dependent methyltransferase